MTKKKYLTVLERVFIALLLLFMVSFAKTLEAQSRSITPKLIIKGNFNSNIDAVDEEELDIDPVKQSWIDYILGLEAVARQVSTELGMEASVGYAQYVDTQGDLEDIADISPNNYDFFRATGEAWFKYFGRRVSVDLIDKLVRTRSLEDLYGPGTSVISYRYLYTDNVASIQLRFSPSQKSRTLLRASYETLVFDSPENEYLEYSEPADSNEVRGYIRFEYLFSPKTMGFIDLQGGQRLFADDEIASAWDADGVPIDYVEIELTDYNFYQGLLGVRHSFSERTHLTVSGGAHYKDFFDPGALELLDYTTPVGRIDFTQLEEYRYRLNLIAEAGSSLYGMDLFFNYMSGSAKFTYYLIRTLSVGVYGAYKQDTFDVEINDREDVWDHNRIDDLVYYGANLDWDIVQKNNNTWLALSLFYTHRTRTSNITELDDYVVGYAGPVVTYDTDIDYYGGSIKFMPTILMGN